MRGWGLGLLAMLAAAVAGAPPALALNPIPTPIAKSGLTVELADFATPPASSSTVPRTLLNGLTYEPDGSGYLFVVDDRGFVYRIDRNGHVDARPFLDVAAALGSTLIGRTGQQGLRNIALHPDYAKVGAPGYGRFYLATTEAVDPSPAPGVRVFTGPFTAQSQDVVTEWRVDPSDPSRADPTSRRVLMRINDVKTDHNADRLLFDPNARPGDYDYGLMYIGVGDGGNNPTFQDQFSSAQDPGRALGKILCIDPLPGPNGAAYRVPDSNPFVHVKGALGEVWALGLRNPEMFSFDLAGGAMVLADIGQAQIEEVNIGRTGANYGWPLRQGRFVNDRTNENVLSPLPADETSTGFTPPVAQYDHDEGASITGGFVYRGQAIPALRGQYVFGDIVNGRIFHAALSDLLAAEYHPLQGAAPGAGLGYAYVQHKPPAGLPATATIYELSLTHGGLPTTLLTLANGGPGRVDLRLGQDQDGEIYVSSKRNGVIYRLAPAR